MIPDKKPRDPDSGKLLYLGWLLLKQRNCLQCKRSWDGVGAEVDKAKEAEEQTTYEHVPRLIRVYL